MKEKIIKIIENWRDGLPYIENIFSENSYYFTKFDLDNLLLIIKKSDVPEEIKKIALEEAKLFRRTALRSKRRNTDKTLGGLLARIENHISTIKAKGEEGENG